MDSIRTRLQKEGVSKEALRGKCPSTEFVLVKCKTFSLMSAEARNYQYEKVCIFDRNLVEFFLVRELNTEKIRTRKNETFHVVRLPTLLLNQEDQVLTQVMNWPGINMLADVLKKKINPFCSNTNQILEFLSQLFQNGLLYRTITNYRSGISVLHDHIQGKPVGNTPEFILWLLVLLIVDLHNQSTVLLGIYRQ